MDSMPLECAAELVDLAQAGMPNEVCGFVLVDWELMVLRNTSPTPGRNFTLDQEVHLDMLMYHREEVLGIFHSHPSGRNYPSEPDSRMLYLYPDMRHWIVTAMDVFEWRMADDGPRPVRRDGSTGLAGVAYPVLAPAEAVRRTS